MWQIKFSEHKNLPRFFAKRRKIFCLYFIKCWKVCEFVSQTHTDLLGCDVVHPAGGQVQVAVSSGFPLAHTTKLKFETPDLKKSFAKF